MRNERYLSAYRILGTAIVFILIAMYTASDAQRISCYVASHHFQALFWSVL